MDKMFTLEILTPERTVFTGSVASLVAPGALGYLGILANHAPLMTTLTPGRIICRDSEITSGAASSSRSHDSGGQLKIFQSTGAGFLQVHHNQVTLLADGITP